jgi:hypothetical protein
MLEAAAIYILAIKFHSIAWHHFLRVRGQNNNFSRNKTPNYGRKHAAA